MSFQPWRSLRLGPGWSVSPNSPNAAARLSKTGATVPAEDVLGDLDLPDGFHWEYRDGFDGGGSSPGHCWPATRYRRAVGPWEVARKGGRP